MTRQPIGMLLDGGSTSILQYIPVADHQQLYASPMWTSLTLLKHPEAVKELHKMYIRAGANLISCLTYQQSELTMLASVSGRPSYDAGMSLALEAAAELQSSAKPVLTLGSHAAMLGNGAEYSLQYQQSDIPLLRDFHTRRLMAFASAPSYSSIQYLAFETFPDVLEAIVLLDVLRKEYSGLHLEAKRIWISFSCVGSAGVRRLLSRMKDLLSKEDTNILWGVGVNCFHLDIAEELIPGMASLLESTELFFIVYPDNGQVWDPLTRRFDGASNTPESWARTLRQWSHMNHNRTILGGCCQTTPEHTEALRKNLQD